MNGVFNFEIFYRTILHLACKSGRFDLVKYLFNLDKFDGEEVTVSYWYFLKFQILNYL